MTAWSPAEAQFVSNWKKQANGSEKKKWALCAQQLNAKYGNNRTGEFSYSQLPNKRAIPLSFLLNFPAMTWLISTVPFRKFLQLTIHVIYSKVVKLEILEQAPKTVGKGRIEGN